ncbi:MAG TPA: type II toxin-antitoxin system death-on-curing family toxin [Candidatus Acidoferrales bacterium]|nr:type II toxin-antitoxin system death-on-curing family toxin [Candidatus Acidoferrales bacterium]
MKYLTVADILLLHNLVIDEFGGSHGLRDLGLLESAVMRPQATFDGSDLYKTVYNKAAALLHSLLMNHQFVDGNKRTAMLSVMTFLELNGYLFNARQKEVVEYALYIENSQPKIEEISVWLKNHSKKIPKTSVKK